MWSEKIFFHQFLAVMRPDIYGSYEILIYYYQFLHVSHVPLFIDEPDYYLLSTYRIILYHVSVFFVIS